MGQQGPLGQTEEAETATGAVNSPWPGHRSIGAPHLHLRRHYGWQIELLFRTLKSGCRIEQRRFEDVERVLPCLGLYLIVAWRTLFVCRLGRSCPEMDCEAIFEPSEWKAVWVAVHGQEPPKRVPSLPEMVHLIARLGGYVERRNSEPGTQTLWLGLQRMYDLAWAWDSFGPGAKGSSG